MPGDNSCIVNCSTSRGTKGIGIFKLPAEKVNREWQRTLLNEIMKTREDDKDFKSQTDCGTVHIDVCKFTP